MSFKPTNRQPHLFAYHAQFPFRFIKNIPYWLKDKICHCDQFDYGTYLDPEPKYKVQTCKTCNRYSVTLLFQCIDCNEHFFKDFRHPKFCRAEHFRCWDCLNKFIENNDELCCHRVKWNMPAPDDILPPVGISARRLSDEEINSILGDEFDLNF